MIKISKVQTVVFSILLFFLFCISIPFYIYKMHSSNFCVKINQNYSNLKENGNNSRLIDSNVFCVMAPERENFYVLYSNEIQKYKQICNEIKNKIRSPITVEFDNQMKRSYIEQKQNYCCIFCQFWSSKKNPVNVYENLKIFHSKLQSGKDDLLFIFVEEHCLRLILFTQKGYIEKVFECDTYKGNAVGKRLLLYLYKQFY